MSGKKGMKQYNAEQIEQMRRLQVEGHTHREIGRQMGLSREQVMKYFERQRKRARAIASGDMRSAKGGHEMGC